MQGHTEETKQPQPHPGHGVHFLAESSHRRALQSVRVVLAGLTLPFDKCLTKELQRCHLHEVRPEAMDDGTQSKATFPGGGQVSDINVPVSLCLLLAPRQKLVRPNI